MVLTLGAGDIWNVGVELVDRLRSVKMLADDCLPGNAEALPGRVSAGTNERHTSWRIGGPADVLCNPPIVRNCDW